MMKFEKGFTVLELLVITAIIACFILGFLPVLSRTRENARRVTCANNLKKIGRAAIAYSHDHDGYLFPTVDSLNPPTRRIRDFEAFPRGPEIGLGKLFKTEYLHNPAKMGCPSSNHARPSEVKLNWNSGGRRIDSAYFYRGQAGENSLNLGTAKPALVMDYNRSDAGLYNHKGEYVNVLFTDGIVKGASDRGLVMDGDITVEADRVFLAADIMRKDD